MGARGRFVQFKFHLMTGQVRKDAEETRHDAAE
jgi:hypothetical protein